MNRHQHPSNNDVLGAPKGWVQGDVPCGALPITRTEVGGLSCVVSFWKPSAAELAVLNSGGSVSLWVVGATMPPVILEVDPL